MNRAEHAGAVYKDGLERIRTGRDSGLWMIAMHITRMLKGDNNFSGPLWQDRALQPDGKRVVLTDFCDYLLRQPRDGLGFASRLQVDRILRAEGDKGRAALVALREAVPSWDALVKGDLRAEMTKRASDNPLAKRGQRGPAKAPGSPVMKKGGDAPDYIIKRLERDGHADLIKQIKRGELSPHKAAVKAGIYPAMWSAPQDVDKLAAALDRRYPGVFTRR
jgi:hypothetical protein